MSRSMNRHEASVVIASPQGAQQPCGCFTAKGRFGSAGQGDSTQRHPHAAVVSMQAPYPSPLGRNQERFPVVGVTKPTHSTRPAG